MPVYEYRCIQGHAQDEFMPIREKDYAVIICKTCGSTMNHFITGSNRMLYFEEGRGRVMTNLGVDPVTVHSHAELEKKMKEKGFEFAGNRRGTKGCWI